MISNYILLIIITMVIIFMLFIMLEIKNKFDNYFNNNHKKNYFIITGLIIGLLFIVLSFFAPTFFINDSVKSFLGITHDTGFIGDTIGGLTSPFIGIAGVAFTFLAFYMQKIANDDIRNQFKIQQFENQFFEMIRLHKENINEMKITGYEALIETSKQKDTNGTLLYLNETIIKAVRFTEGRKCFVTMNTELIACYELLESCNNINSYNIEVKDLLDLAYQFFFFGSHSSIVKNKNVNPTQMSSFRDYLNFVKKTHKNSFGVRTEYNGLGGKKIKLHIKYSPFSGHENRLGHYYRHLYGTVRYVVDKENEGFFDYKKSREYLKMLRSQMSNDEQLLLYYNYIIGFGKDWEKYLTKYRMLHNLPIDEVKYVEKPRQHFKYYIDSIKNGEGSLFEWGD